jgi:aminopeptidase N
MIRMLMYDPRQGGDARFQAMMRDLIKTYFNRDISTEDFKHAVEKHITPEMNLMGNGKLDWFFNQWVYGTEIPSYKFDYQFAPGEGGKVIMSGHLTQSGVSDKFRMVVPIYLDFGKGWVRLGTATVTGSSSVAFNNIQLSQAPRRAAVCALNDVLAVNIENTRK